MEREAKLSYHLSECGDVGISFLCNHLIIMMSYQPLTYISLDRRVNASERASGRQAEVLQMLLGGSNMSSPMHCIHG